MFRNTHNNTHSLAHLGLASVGLAKVHLALVGLAKVGHSHELPLARHSFRSWAVVPTVREEGLLWFRCSVSLEASRFFAFCVLCCTHDSRLLRAMVAFKLNDRRHRENRRVEVDRDRSATVQCHQRGGAPPRLV